jgi:site-specific DNA recombinase
VIINDPAVDFGVLANREKLAERHVRFLAPLAYLSPRVIQAIAESGAPADLTVTRLARNLPLSWAEQEERLGIV